jgi:hypothetical protein
LTLCRLAGITGNEKFRIRVLIITFVSKNILYPAIISFLNIQSVGGVFILQIPLPFYNLYVEKYNAVRVVLQLFSNSETHRTPLPLVLGV